MSYDRMKQEEKRLRQEIRELTARARKTDRSEDKQYGPEVRGDELPAELSRRQDRLEKIEQARKRLEARQEERDRAEGRSPQRKLETKRGRAASAKRKWIAPAVECRPVFQPGL